MREILFRAKRKDNKKWIEGYLLKYSPIYEEVTCILPLHSVDVTDVEVSPETVCQYIGLTNKNGRKIFEGDIVKHDMTDTVGTVKWYQEDYVGWCVDDVQIGEQQFTYEMWGECEIIGSIFDNVDLLKE